jgi:hypothetical protein
MSLVLIVALFGCGGKKAPDEVDDESADVSGRALPAITGYTVGDTINLGAITYQSVWGGAAVSRDYNWRVLAVEDGKVLVITEDIIEVRHYFVGSADITWEDCNVREWLNDAFYSGFPEDLKLRVADTAVVNSAPVAGRASGGNDTTDKVFLLSVEEAERYFPDDAARRAKVDIDGHILAAVCTANGLDESFLPADKYWFWWLRTPGEYGYQARTVDGDGAIYDEGHTVYYTDGGVRPAMWITL